MSAVHEFRARARAWLADNASPLTEGRAYDPEGTPETLEEARRFQASLYEAGFAGINWPTEYGGQGLGRAEAMAFTLEASAYAMPTVPFIIGLGMPGPTILEVGTQEQRTRYLPKMLSGEEIWCQLFSEPSTGSDVASLKTSATRTDSGWVLNGQKVWTSGAQYSDFGTILARTDPTRPKHQGLTMFIVDMHHPGVTVRPLRVATGHAPFNEVFFDDVPVREEDVLGEVDGGWATAVVMLRHERVTLGTMVRGQDDPLGYAGLSATARERGLDDDPSVRRRLAELYAREAGLAAFSRQLTEEAHAGTDPGARGSVAKLVGADLGLWAADVASEVLGHDLALGVPELASIELAALAGPGTATAGGSMEIQRNIIGERVLGLPKDPGVAARDTPFNQLRLSD